MTHSHRVRSAAQVWNGGDHPRRTCMRAMPHRHHSEPERGFALLAVLWVMVGMTALGLAISLAARQSVAAAENRTNLTRAAWTAEACLAGARAVIADALRSDGTSAQTLNAGWNALDRVVASSPLVAGPTCDISLRATGTSVDVNSADPEMLLGLCRALEIPDAEADSLVAALLDWRDADDVPHLAGAERAWYAANMRALPRNGPLADRRELLRVRGFDAVPSLDSLLDVEPGRIELNRAPLAVLAALPGMTAEAISRVTELRLRGVQLSDLTALSAQLSPSARQVFLARYADLVRLTTTTPDAWIVTSRAHAGASPSVTAVLEVRLVRAGARAAIVRRRTWIE